MTELEQKVIEAACAAIAWAKENDQITGMPGVQHTALYQGLLAAVNDYNTEQFVPSGPLRVHASVHDDEYYHEVSGFDCTPWFEQAADEDFVELATCEFGGDYPADRVAEYFQYNNNYPGVVKLFAYKKTGFECHVDEDEAVAWIQVNRPHLMHQNVAYPNNEKAYEIRLPKKTIS